MQIRLVITGFIAAFAISSPLYISHQVSNQITLGDGYQIYMEGDPDDQVNIVPSSVEESVTRIELTGDMSVVNDDKGGESVEVHIDQFGKEINTTPPKTLSNSNDVSPPVQEILHELNKSYEVRKGDTVIGILSSLGVSSFDITTLLYGSSLAESDFLIGESDKIVLFVNNLGLMALELHKGGNSYDVFTKLEGVFLKTTKLYPTSLVEVKKDFVISSSFISDAIAAGLTVLESNELSNNLRHVIDFKRIRPGHMFRVVMDREIRNGKIIASTIKGVLFGNSEQSKKYYKFDGSYFDENGVGVTPVFLKHPIQTQGTPLITSRFNLQRIHPILKIRRPHYGTDYGYLTGTPVVSISDSVVIYAGNKGSFGNIVKLKHPNGVITLSAHLSKIEKGIVRGAKVPKGKVIGYVGSTGVSTGPHLHFEMFQHGRRVDSLTINLPTKSNVDDIDEFRLFVNSIDLT
ncbi:TPA: hypothetical protein I7730_13990 [Vibrio vulnificus]|uniref:Peptidase M23 n=1 Tax=Vibrio vulnificus TaxID=672 RepID=A0A8H9TFL8_VIBVL|nr:peptidoglycan DD-metalloendopeptidase family protein [Vibrio vulnificus]HAS8540896.1 hypothetical protein [Vibrio vulnificus]